MGLLLDIKETVAVAPKPGRVNLLDIAQQIEPYIPQTQKKGFFESNKDGWRLGSLDLARAMSGLLDSVGPPEKMKAKLNVEEGQDWTLKGEGFAKKIEDLIEDHPEWQNPPPPQWLRSLSPAMEHRLSEAREVTKEIGDFPIYVR